MQCRFGSTDVTGIVDALSNVELRVRKPREHVGDRATGGVPTAQRARNVSVRQLALERSSPALAIRLLAAIENRAILLIEISQQSGARCIAATDNRLRGKRILREEQLAVRYEAERVLIVAWSGEGIRGDVRGQRTKRLEDDVLMRRPGVRSIPMSRSREIYHLLLARRVIIKHTIAGQSRGTCRGTCRCSGSAPG